MSVIFAQPHTAPVHTSSFEDEPQTTAVVPCDGELPLITVNDLSALADSARKTFQIFEPWSQAEFTVENDLLQDIVTFIKMQSGSYCRALNMSLGTSRNCVILSDAATSLCSGIAERRDEKELSASLEFLLQITKSGAEQSEEVVKKFRAVRQGLFQLTSRIPYAVEQVAFEHRVCEKSKKRHQRAHRHLGRVHRAFAGITENIVPVVAPLISAAIPGLGIVLPVAFPLATLAAEKVAEQFRLKVEKRDKQQIACADAIKRLELISNDVGEVIEHVGKFTAWWQDMEYTFHGLRSRIQSPLSLDPVLLNITRDRFAEIGQKNRTYISDITRLQDFFPKLVENDGFQKRIATIAPQGDLGDILQSMSKSTHQYYLAYHRLQVSAGRARDRHRSDLNEFLEAIRHSLHAECETLSGLLQYIIHAAQVQYEDTQGQEIRHKLNILMDNACTTHSTFEDHKSKVVAKLPSSRFNLGRRDSKHHREYKQLSNIMHGLVANTEGISPIDSLEHAIQQQNTSIQDLVRYFNRAFSAITYSAIAYIDDSDGKAPSEFWQLDRTAVTEALDKISVSVDSLAKPQLALIPF